MCGCNEVADPGRWVDAGVEPSLDEMLNDPIVRLVLDAATLPLMLPSNHAVLEPALA
jgi:hypothetical protein